MNLETASLICFRLLEESLESCAAPGAQAAEQRAMRIKRRPLLKQRRRGNGLALNVMMASLKRESIVDRGKQSKSRAFYCVTVA